MSDIELQKIEAGKLIKDQKSSPANSGAVMTDIPLTNKDDEYSCCKPVVGWGSMIINFLKVLIFGLCVFIYDITSKFDF